jgi:hypothetical protein
MAQERDTRPLAEIRFAQDLPADLQVGSERRVRKILQEAGVAIAQDIIDLGCTGLLLRIGDTDGGLGVAQYIRGQMSGSICGLPCYVPRDRYCLVHDTIGGLQLAGNLDGPQAMHHPEALPFMSRELTDEERMKVGGIKAKLDADAKQAAMELYGAQDVLEEESEEATSPAPSCPIPQPPFKCPDHKEPDWECRKCLAQAIVDSRIDMRKAVRVYVADVDMTGRRNSIQASLDEALEELNSGDGMPVELWVRVASWSKKVTRD